MPRADALHVASLGRLGFAPASHDRSRGNNINSRRAPHAGKASAAAGRRTQQCLDDLREKIRGQLQSEVTDIIDNDAKGDARAGVLSATTSRVFGKLRSAISLVSGQRHVQENCALHRIASRFEYYAVKPRANGGASASGAPLRRPYLDRAGIRRMLAHVQGKQSAKIVSAVMDALDTHHNGRIYFDEFVSFASYDRSELAEIAMRLRRKLKNGAKSSLYHCFGLVADPKSQLVSSSLVLTLIDKKLDFQLTPGEANWVAARIGPALANFKRFLKSNVQDLMRSWTLEDHWVSDIALSMSAKQALEHESRGLTPVQVSANLDCTATSVKALPKFWARIAQVGDLRARNGGESDDASEDSVTDSESEDDDADGARSASEEEHHTDDDDDDDGEEEEEEEEEKSNVSDDSDAYSDFAHSRRIRSPSAKRKSSRQRQKHRARRRANRAVEKREAPVTQLEIAQSKTDAGLVADGFVCVETPLNGHRMFERKPSFLWIKKEALRYDANAAPDAVLELAVTLGRAAKLTSPIWAPPSRGFKRLAFNFGPAGRQFANVKHDEEPYAEGTRALDCFLWYRKADATYAREYLADLRTSRLVARGPDDKSLQARLRERVRAQVAELRKSQGARFDPADILDAVAPHSDRLKKRQFVQGMSKLGIQLSISDLAAIFDKLDVFGANYVLREDVIDFFELSDKEIESILIQLRAFLRRSKRKGESPMQIFRELDANGNGKLSARELHKLLRRMGILASLAEAQRLIDRIDTNENGAVDMNEFLEFVQRGTILGGISARAANISSNVRDAARTLHAISRKQAHLGTDSGRLSSKLDTRHAWQRLLGPSDEYGTILTAGRVRRILQKRGLRLRMEEVQTLLRALEPAFERVGGLTFPSFDSFVRLSEPVENNEGLWYDDSEHANRGVAIDADAGSGTSADLRFRSALANLHADLSMMAVSEDVDDAGLFELLFPSAGGGKVLRQQFLQGLDHVGALARFRAASDRDRLATVFDCDRDGMVSVHDLSQFLRDSECGLGQLMHPSKGEEDKEDDDASSRASSSSTENYRGDWLATEPSPRRERQVRGRRARQSSSASPPKRHRSPDGRGSEKVDTWSQSGSEGEEEEEARSDEDDLAGVELASNLIASDVRKSWLLHLDSMHVDSAPFGARNHRNYGVVRAEKAINVQLLQAAAESAAREHGGPLRLRKRFSKLDPAGHGTISKKAFATVLRRVRLEIPRSERDALQNLLLTRTGQRSRRVDYELFCDIVERSSEIRDYGVDRVHQRLGALFQHVDARSIMETFDRKGEGSLSTSDFQRALDLCGVKISKFDWSVLRPQLAQDGRINYIALCEMIETADLAHPLAKRQNRKPDEVRLFRALAEHRGALAEATASTDLRRVFEVYDEPGLGVIPVSEAVSALRDLVQQCQLQGLVPLELLRSVATRYVAKEDQFDYLAFCSAFDHSAVHVADHDVFLRKLGEQIRAGFETTGLSFHQAMARYDPEGTGKLSRYAFRRCIRHDLGVRVAEHELACLMDLAETHADGVVDYLELEKKMSLQKHAVVGASLVRQREVVDALRRAIDKRRRKDPFFDLRKCFRCHTGGRSAARMHELTSLLGNLGVFVSAEDVSALCSHRNVLTLDAFARFVDTDETEWDIIATRCQQRMEELSREGVVFSRECSLHRAPENASPSGISRSRFVDVCHRLGMPLSASQLDLVLLRFKEPGGSPLVAFRPFVDFVQARARQVALEGLGEDFF